MSDEQHKIWEWRSKWHKGEYGCYFRHGDPTKYEPCDYQLNGYDASRERESIYNGNHRAIAEEKGYLTDDFGDSRLAELLDAYALEQNRKRLRKRGPVAGNVYRANARVKGKRWKRAMRIMIQSSIGLLRIDPKAWHINHQIKEEVWPWFGPERRKQRPPAKNFLPRNHGGWHFMFPYRHNHHHMISVGAFRECVINAPAEHPVSRFRRAVIVLRSGWNINNKDNIVLLPTDIAPADIVGLPAHCPYRTRSHPAYSQSLEQGLQDIRESIDNAIEEKAHDELQDVKIKAEKLQKTLFDQIKAMRGPLGAVSSKPAKDG